MRRSAEDYVINQIGLAAFSLQGEQWVVKTYNFTLFPREFEGMSKVFACDAGSLGFLANHKFDFNKMIYHGIPFMPLAQQEHLLKVRLLILEWLFKNRTWASCCPAYNALLSNSGLSAGESSGLRNIFRK